MNYIDLVATITTLHGQTLGSAVAAVHRALLVRNWLIGGWIVEFEQRGADRATYGSGLLKRLSADLETSGLRGTSPDVLERMRGFYRTYPQVGPVITAQSLPQFPPSPELRRIAASGEISATVSRKSSERLVPPLPAEAVFRFTWSHVVELLRLDDPWKRAFYENETLGASWSLRELRRQIGSSLYERTGLSIDKQAVIAAARTGSAAEQPMVASQLRDPYVLEFTGLAERAQYRESDLAAALLDHLQAFLLELGTGFCFEARQKRISVGNEHDWIDLVFYHRVLRCHLLIDLKVRSFTHGDAGQMNFYLQWWKDHMLGASDQPPVGLILCSDKDETKVHYATAGLDHQLFVSRYQVALPSVEALQHLVETDRALLDQRAAPEKEPP